MDRIIGKNKSKNFNGKCNKSNFDRAKQSATVVLKTASKISIQKTAEATGDLIGSKLEDKVKCYKQNKTCSI